MDPILSICITSCNRLKYTKALIESLSEFWHDPDVEIIVVDMWSTEPGLREYLNDLMFKDIIDFPGMSYDLERDWINDEYVGRNVWTQLSRGKYLMALQDDGQFIGNKDILWKYIEDFEQMKDAHCLEIYGVRKQTMRDVVDTKPLIVNERKYWRRSDRHLTTTGIYKREIFKTIGDYPTNWPMQKEYWGRSETWYANQFKQTFPGGQVYRVHVPLMLSIWNDPLGGYAFIREDKRFGHYLDPVGGPLYYEKNVDNDVVERCNLRSESPLSFMDIVKPIGWTIATTPDGEQKKYSQWEVMQQGPFEILPKCVDKSGRSKFMS